MRPPRIVILALFFAACLFLLCRAITSIGRPTPTIASPQSSERSGFRSFFSFSTPFTLFPPNAIITIADDNSTSFAARPAAFGPPLPSKGLNGQLWIGSGFTEESMQDGEGEGELGCSDVPGWDDGSSRVILKTSNKDLQDKPKSAVAVGKSGNQKRHDSLGPLVDRSAATRNELKSTRKPVDDGTDDYLHQSLDKAQKSTTDAPTSSGSGHADIQSIQEGAEIAGKIVLLSRGGCGFLEKVKWAQRRGAVGLVVGDNQRGGPLIQMYAHGDTSNVTIPSIFTSRTTAYLLSLMMQPGSFIEDFVDEHGKPTQKTQQSDRSGKTKKARAANGASPKPRAAPVFKGSNTASSKSLRASSSDVSQSGPSWFSRLFKSPSAASRPLTRSSSANKGTLDWVVVEDFSDEKDRLIKNSLDRASNRRTGSNTKPSTRQPAEDDFQIGVEDWRDPDLIGTDKSQGATEAFSKSNRGSTEKPSSSGSKTSSKSSSSLDYAAEHMPAKGKDAIASPKDKTSASGSTNFISKMFGDDDETDFESEEELSSFDSPILEKPTPAPATRPEEREGLWVIITPSSGASPFFDTLLVLVISPLITLTVVYALLILRARIRRRRWRAPKSVVERLPVRTYHTVASTPSHSPRLPSPTSSSPTTPLLQSQHSSSRPRPRSRTTTGIPSAGDLLDVNAALAMPRPSPREHEKRRGPSEWKKYMGRQVECVVCLEEYVDGVSQVMSLPCGHEFHVDCITPWLTTRRRTCPICKGDVVRSLARGSPSSPRYEPYRDDSDDDMLAQTAGQSSDAPLGEEDDLDVEQGLSRSNHRSHQESWFTTLSQGLRDRFSTQNRQPSEDGSNRDR
ncbi:hypothetical protein F5Y15DRAFT_383491 [Xylariaceae sp. FL0016]|nr:hypothetical protein F5Y15DRAFT_383491 [Xylariaceae sp. FL0016]